MRKYIIKNKLFYGYCLLVIVDAINVAVMALLLKSTMDAATEGDIRQLVTVIKGIVIFLIEYSAVSYSMRLLKAIYYSKIMSNIRADLFEAIVENDDNDRVAKTSGEFLSVFNNDLQIIKEKGIEPIFCIIKSVVVLLLSIIILIRINFFVAVVAIFLSLFPILIPKIWKKRLSASTIAYTNSFREYNRTIEDVLQGLKDSKQYESESYIISRHQISDEKLKKRTFYLGKDKAGSDMTTNFIAVGMQFCVFALSGYYVIIQVITAGDVLAITQLMNKVMNPVFDIIDSLNDLNIARPIKRQLMSLIETKSIQNDTAFDFGEGLERIVFDNVGFSYNNEDIILSNISVRFEAGRKYAIIGENGSGKTTFLKLINGELRAKHGSISYNDTMMTSDRNALKKSFSVISQHIHLFDGTIKENIVFDNEVDNDRLNEVLRITKLDEFLQQKGETVDYQLYENGGNISGGEREKIAIARALYRGKSWLLLDEATAEIDNEALFQIESYILGLKDVTCISVTHRLHENLLKQYDEILLFSGGQIIGRGTYEALLRRNNAFLKSLQCELS